LKHQIDIRTRFSGRPGTLKEFDGQRRMRDQECGDLSPKDKLAERSHRPKAEGLMTWRLALAFFLVFAPDEPEGVGVSGEPTDRSSRLIPIDPIDRFDRARSTRRSDIWLSGQGNHTVQCFGGAPWRFDRR
jgi:hypothetical protein